MARSENSKIVTKIQEDFAYENGIGRFSVIVADNNTKVNWFQNGTLIESSNFSILKMEQTAFENQRCLIVKNCVDSDFCKYTVKTEDGKEEYSTYLTKSLRLVFKNNLFCQKHIFSSVILKTQKAAKNIWTKLIKRCSYRA